MDSVDAGSGADRIISRGYASEGLSGGEGDDYIISYRGSWGGANGGEGDDIVIENGGLVTTGGPGDDLVMGGTSETGRSGGQLSGGPGNDRVIAAPLGNWTLWDTPGDDNDSYEANGNPHVR